MSATRFELRKPIRTYPGDRRYIGVRFAIKGDGALIDDGCGTPMRESLTAARNRWRDLVARGYRPAEEVTP